MTSDWVKFTELLSTIVDNRGKTCPVQSHGVPLIATNCINGIDLYPDYDTTRYVSEETYKTWFRGHPKPNDILFVCKGSPGRTNWVQEPVDFCIAQDMVSVRADPEKVYPKYLFAALRSNIVQAQILNMHVGTMIPHFKKGDFDKLLIPMLSKNAQVEVGDLYFDLSKRISDLQKSNQTLEAIASTLFKSWFINYEPVHANARDSEASLITDSVSTHFPSRFVESELGPIPEGWHVKPIGDVIETLGGATPNTKVAEYWSPALHYWTSPKDLYGMKSPILLKTERKVSDAGLKKISSGLLPAGTLLLSSRAPIGYLAISQVPIAINQGYIAMTPGRTLSPLFMLMWCKANMDSIEARANGSTFMEISKKAFRPIPIVVPPDDVLKLYEETASSIFKKMVINEKQRETLLNMRDILLPRLISKKLTVEESQNGEAEA